MLLDSKHFDHKPVHPSADFTNGLPNELMKILYRQKNVTLTKQQN